MLDWWLIVILEVTVVLVVAAVLFLGFYYKNDLVSTAELYGHLGMSLVPYSAASLPLLVVLCGYRE